jgi:uncharacterized membrane protein YdbT with pleckstrin-like domain
MKKLLSIIIKTTGDLAFTFSGFAVLYFTLSGDTRRMATIAMFTACVVHYIHQVVEGMRD